MHLTPPVPAATSVPGILMKLLGMESNVVGSIETIGCCYILATVAPGDHIRATVWDAVGARNRFPIMTEMVVNIGIESLVHIHVYTTGDIRI
ncbi:MAG: hypothetical protein JST14_03765, partial [Bacteroidetes bacterium]|nr:hypothetical protein [Bacteroidota bacterium]